MPYMIVKENGKVCVHKQNANKSAGESLHCYSGDNAEKDAKAYMRALYANTENMQMSKGFAELQGKSLDAMAQAIRDAFYRQYDRMTRPVMEAGGYIKEVFDGYVIIDDAGELYKATYSVNGDEVTFQPHDEWQKVKQEYVALSFSERMNKMLHFFGLAELAVTKSEGDGNHPSSHYLVVEDPAKPSTWHLRIRDANGKLDHRLMGQAASALGLGKNPNKSAHGNPYEGPNKEAAIKKLKALYKSEGLSLPGTKKNMNMDFTFTELSNDGEDAHYIDGMSASPEGHPFISMSGAEVEIKAEDLQSYIDNTMPIIESTRTEKGEIVGLPIDANKHDHLGGAGWIVGLELDKARNVVRFLVKWTKEGTDLITGNIRRFFSPSIDTENKTILGGSMTNWPGTRNDKGQILLRPVELSQSIKEIDMAETLKEILDNFTAKVAEAVGQKPQGQTQTTQPQTDPAQPVDLSNVVNPSLAALVKDPDKLAELDAGVQELVKQKVNQRMRQDHTKKFVAELIGGTQSEPYGFAVKQKDLIGWMLSLTDAQAKFAENLLNEMRSKAVDFAAHGISSEGFLQLPQLPAPILKTAREWIAQGHTIDEFFEVNKEELGSPEKYNLSEFIKEK